MRDVDGPDAPGHLGDPNTISLLLECSGVPEKGSVPGQEDENFGGVRETEIVQREPGKPIAGNMIDKDKEECQPTEEVHPRIAPIKRCTRGLEMTGAECRVRTHCSIT